MNIEKIENNLEKLPESLQLLLMVSIYPFLMLLCILGISGFFILIDFIVRG